MFVDNCKLETEQTTFGSSSWATCIRSSNDWEVVLEYLIPAPSDYFSFSLQNMCFRCVKEKSQ